MRARRPIHFGRHRVRGVSLVEIMVSLALGLVLVTGVLSLYRSTHLSFRHHESLARLQESGRFALELMTREIREAGLTPCGSPLTANLLVAAAGAATPWWADTAAGFLRGGENSGQGVVVSGDDAGDHVANTDSLLLLRTANAEDALATVLTHDVATQTLTLRAPAPLRARDIVVLCDDRSSALWQVDMANVNPATLTYTAAPLNCATALGRVDARCQSAVDKTFMEGALVAPWDPGLWYVGNNNSGQRSLYRAEVIQPAAGAASPALITRGVEKVPGVYDLQIDYLTRDRTNGGALAAQWQKANDLGANWADPTLEVTAVRITLTLQGERMPGANARSIQRTFRSLVALRNREP
jgi:type IV pilus assembly protein PilW